jgi:hypothetical protein
MNITEQELKQLEDAKTDAEWNQAVDQIKARRSGAYPPDWYAKVINGGLQPQIDTSITIRKF